MPGPAAHQGRVRATGSREKGGGEGEKDVGGLGTTAAEAWESRPRAAGVRRRRPAWGRPRGRPTTASQRGARRLSERLLVVLSLRRLHVCGQRVLRLVALGPQHIDPSIITACVKLHQLGDVKLRLLQNLHLLDMNVLQWEDALSLLLDLLADGLGDKLLDKVA